MNLIFFDTESTALDAGWGRLLCASFVALEGEVWTYRADKRPFKTKDPIDDSRLAIAIREVLEPADMVVSQNGKMHDVPLVNACLARVGERPIRLKRHLDVMYYFGYSSMKIGGKSLDNAARFFKSPNQKTPLDKEIWKRAAAGDRKSLDLVADHCQQDALVLRDLFPSVAPLVKQFNANLSQYWKAIKEVEG